MNKKNLVNSKNIINKFSKDFFFYFHFCSVPLLFTFLSFAKNFVFGKKNIKEKRRGTEQK